MRIFWKKKFAISIIYDTTTKYKVSLFCYIKFSQTFFEIYPFLPLFTTTTNGLVSQIFFFDPSGSNSLKNMPNTRRQSSSFNQSKPEMGYCKKKSNLITHYQLHKPSNWCITNFHFFLQSYCNYQLPIFNYFFVR